MSKFMLLFSNEKEQKIYQNVLEKLKFEEYEFIGLKIYRTCWHAYE